MMALASRPFLLAAALLLLAPAARADRAPMPTTEPSFLQPEGGLALGISPHPCQLQSYLRTGISDACLGAQLLARFGLGMGRYFTPGLRQLGYLDNNSFAWGSSFEVRFNLPLGPVELYLSGGAGPGLARQTDGGFVRSTGVALYTHGGGGLRLLEGGPMYLEFAIEAQHWAGQGALSSGGLEEHVDLTRPFFLFSVGYRPSGPLAYK